MIPLGDQCAFSGPVDGPPGLTKREYFAAMAMQGFIASDDAENPFSPDSVASRAVMFADALLDALTPAQHIGASS